MSQQYTQCKLSKGNTSQVSWIPSEFAIKGKKLELKDINLEKDVIQIGGENFSRIDLWDVGWRVEEIYLTEDEERVIPRPQSNGWE